MAVRCRSIGVTGPLAVVLFLGVAVPSAWADVTFKASMKPREISFGKTFELSYRLLMTTGAREERFPVAVRQPRWNPLSSGGPRGFAAVPDCFRRPLVLRGPGQLGKVVCDRSRDRVDTCERGGGHVHLRGEVTLPPHSTTSLVARFLSGGPPLRQTDYRATFKVGGGTNDTLGNVRRFRPPKPAVRGPFGTHITLSTWPRTPYFRFPAGRRFRPGRVFNIRGRTDPSLAGRRMALRYRYIPSQGATPLRTLARVEVGPGGHFGFRGWRPRGLGAYRLYAAYEPRRPDMIYDESCSRGFAIRR